MQITDLLNLLKSETEFQFTELRKQHPTVVFIENDDDLEAETLYFEQRNDITGEAMDIKIICIDPNGIKVSYGEENIDEAKYIGLNDLASIEDKVNLLEKIYSKIQ